MGCWRARGAGHLIWAPHLAVSLASGEGLVSGRVLPFAADLAPPDLGPDKATKWLARARSSNGLYCTGLHTVCTAHSLQCTQHALCCIGRRSMSLFRLHLPADLLALSPQLGSHSSSAGRAIYHFCNF